MSTVHFPREVSSKALAKAKAWLETRRQETAASQERTQELSQALLGGIAETLGDLGVNAIQVGNTRIQLSEVPTAKPSVSERWSAHLASGGEVFVLEGGMEADDPSRQRGLDPGAVQGLTIRQWDCTHCHTHHDRDLAAADNIQAFAVQRFLESFTGAESVPGNRPLHPELAAFISRGGMTAFQRGNSRERRQVQSLGLEVPVNRGSTPTPSEPVMNRLRG